MATIIAGRFETQDDANAAADALKSAGFADTHIQVFYVSPPGMHGNVPIVDNEQPEVGTDDAGRTAVKGALIGAAAGLAVGVLAAPLAVPAAAGAAALAGAGVGAYGSSLAGAVTGAGDSETEEKAERGEPIERHSGMLVAVMADGNIDRAIDTLRAAKGSEIERAEGEWRDGGWADFSPFARPVLVE